MKYLILIIILTNFLTAEPNMESIDAIFDRNLAVEVRIVKIEDVLYHESKYFDALVKKFIDNKSKYELLLKKTNDLLTKENGVSKVKPVFQNTCIEFEIISRIELKDFKSNKTDFLLDVLLNEETPGEIQIDILNKFARLLSVYEEKIKDNEALLLVSKDIENLESNFSKLHKINNFLGIEKIIKINTLNEMLERIKKLKSYISNQYKNIKIIQK